MKTKLFAIALVLGSCEEKQTAVGLSPTARTALEMAVRDAQHAEREQRLANTEVQQLQAENARLRGQIMRMESAVALAESRVENARKLGIVEANLRHASGR